MQITENVYGENHLEVAEVLEFLSESYMNLGDLAKAVELQERALVIAKHVYGENHKRVAVFLTPLGVSYTLAGDVAKARDICERALVISENDEEVVRVLAALGKKWKTMEDCKRREKKAPMNEEAATLAKKNKAAKNKATAALESKKTIKKIRKTKRATK